MRYVLFSLSAIILVCSFSAQAKMYKWVDENGQMHFGDKIPAKYMVKAHEELNQSGVVTSRKAAARTAEEKIEDRRLERERQKAEKIEKKKKQRDRVLLDTYTTERDLIVARDSRLEAVGSQIQLAETIIRDSNKNIEKLEKQITQIKASNREVPESVYHQIDSEKQQVTVQSKVMDSHIKRQEAISTQFNGYIERFKVLKTEQKARRDRLKRERGE